MSLIEEYRRKLSLLQTENMNLLAEIAEAENKLSNLKKEAIDIYEKIDNVLDK